MYGTWRHRGIKGSRDAVPKDGAPSGRVPPTRPEMRLHDCYYRCPAWIGGHLGWSPPSPRGSHPSYLGIGGECLAVAVAPVQSMWYDTQTAWRVTTHLGILGGMVGWQAGQVGQAGQIGQAWQVILSTPTGAMVMTVPLPSQQPEPRASPRFPLPSNWVVWSSGCPPAPASALPRPVKPWKALPGPTPCTSLGQPPGGLVDIARRHTLTFTSNSNPHSSRS